MRKLERSRSDRIVAGVCGGVARYFGIDANVVRILWIVSLLLACVGVIPYVAAIFLLREEDAPPAPGPSWAKVAGFTLIGAGILFLLRTFDARVLDPLVLAFWKFEALGPVMLAVAGALLVWPRLRAFLGGAVRELTATLVTDTLVPSPAVRGSNLALPKLLVFETDEHAVSISVSLEGERTRLLGSIVPKLSESIPSGGSATIYGGTEPMRVDVSDHGEFEAAGVPRGDLHIDIELGDVRIQISPIHTIGPASDPMDD